MDETKVTFNPRLAENVDGLERNMTTKKIITENAAAPNTVDWDNTVVPAATGNSFPVSESFIIPIDAPDKRSTNRQANTYAAKKTVAQGMMDIALITANANQLRYIIEYTSESKTFYLNMTLISMSLLLQVAVGLALIFKGRFDLRGESKFTKARRTNNFVVVGVFLVTIINVFIASFTITGNNTVRPPTTSFPNPGNGQPPVPI